MDENPARAAAAARRARRITGGERANAGQSLSIARSRIRNADLRSRAVAAHRRRASHTSMGKVRRLNTP